MTNLTVSEALRLIELAREVDGKVLARFVSKVRISGSGCWEWTGSKDTRGYGAFWFRGNITRAHRASWMIFKSEIPAGLIVCHTCDNSVCVNPAHLFVGTHLDNAHDRIAKGRDRAVSGELQGSAKLTEPQVMEIASIPRGGKTAHLAKKFGVSKWAIEQVRRGQTWSHVTGITKKVYETWADRADREKPGWRER